MAAFDIQWLVGAILIPVIALLYWQNRQCRRDGDDKIERLRSDLNGATGATRKDTADALDRFAAEMRIEVRDVSGDLAQYKLVVADKYASVEHLREVERRLMDAMDGMAKKLDRLLEMKDGGR